MHAILSSHSRLKWNSWLENSLWIKRLQNEWGWDTWEDGRNYQAYANLVIHLFWNADLRCVYWKTVHLSFFLSCDGLHSEHHHNYLSYNRDSRRSTSCSLQESIHWATQRTLAVLHTCIWKIPRKRGVQGTLKSSSILEQRRLNKYWRKDRGWHDKKTTKITEEECSRISWTIVTKT